jgi:hypothetical protein
MRKAVKSFNEFINENYKYDGILESIQTDTIKKWKDSKMNTIKDVQTFLKEYGTKVIDGKGGSTDLKITGKLDEDTICAFWAFYWGTKSMLKVPLKNPQRKNLNDLKAKVKITDPKKLEWFIKKEVFTIISKKNGDNPVKPYPIWTGLVGSKDYYIERNNDFKKRSKKTPPDYYLNYGNKYCKAFSEKTKKNLSSKGKTWLEKTLVALQQSIEKKLKEDPKIEADSTRFRKYAFDSHPDCYIKSGLFDLDALDIIQIANTPEWKEFANLETWAQMIEIVKKVDLKKAEKMSKLTVDRVWNSAKGKFEEGKKTMAKAITNWYGDAKSTGKKITKKTKEFISWLTECEEQARLEGYPTINS